MQQYEPKQKAPSGDSSYPSKQLHLKLPGEFEQRPFMHIFPFSEHSSMSEISEVIGTWTFTSGGGTHYSGT